MTTSNNNEQIQDEPPIAECEWCNALVPEDEVDYHDTDGGSEQICGECADNANSCNDCGTLCRSRSDMYSTGYGYVCESCYENYGVCEYCDSTFHYDNGPECGCDDRHCANLHDYSYRPSPNFLRNAGELRTKGTLFLGCELEVENHGGEQLSEGVERAYSQSEDEQLFYLKADGSLSHGFELVTHPMTLGYIRDEFGWEVCDSLSRMGYRSWEDDNCGFHIHLSRSAFVSRSHLFKFVWLVYANSEELIKFAGRHSTSYARFEPSELQTLTYKAHGGGQDTRYYALNTQNSRTIEMRFFKGSLNKETLTAYCEMADAMFHYAKSLTINDIANHNGISFRKFTDWSKKQDYPALNARIARRVYPVIEV